MLQLHDVVASYGAIQALRGISLEVHKGEIVTMLGGNGAGKSTTLRTISGLMHARSGSIEFDGQDITAVPAHKLVRLGIGHAPEGRRIFNRLTVLENLQMGAYSRQDKAEIASDYDRVLRPLPEAPGAPRPVGRDALGRRAADARHRPGSDGPAQAAAPR